MVGSLVAMWFAMTLSKTDYYVLITKGTDRWVRRNMHGLLGLIAVLCILAGWAVIFTSHEQKGWSHIASGGKAYVQVRI